MKQVHKNPLFYLSVFLVLVLGFMVANLVGAFTEPSAAFPGGNPAAPLDTSATAQTKSGTLNLTRVNLTGSDEVSLQAGGVCLKVNSGGSVVCEEYWADIGAYAPSPPPQIWQYSGTSTDIYYDAGNVAIGSTSAGGYKLHVSGTAFSTGGWEASDARLKKNVEGISGALNKVLNLTGVYYDWRTDEYPDRGLPEGTQIGFIAQEVEKVFPALVSTGEDGYKALAYDRLTAILLEAVKEQQAQIESLNARLRALENSSE